jgi:hypothetical protein
MRTSSIEVVKRTETKETVSMAKRVQGDIDAHYT